MESSTKIKQEDELSPDTMLVLVKFNTTNNLIRDIHVKKNAFKIGRQIDCDDIILDVTISRNQCILHHRNGQWEITNLSTSGTLLNGIPLKLGSPEPINVHDVVQFGNLEDYKYTVTMYVKDDEPDKKKARIVEQSALDEEIAKQKAFAEQQETIRKELERELELKRQEQDTLATRLEEMIKSQEAVMGITKEKNDTIKNLEEQIKRENEVLSGLTNNYQQLESTMDIQRKEFQARLNDEAKKWQETLDMSKQEKEALQTKMTEEMTKAREIQQAAWQKVLDEAVRRENDIKIKLSNEKALLEQKLKEANDALKEKTELAEKLQHQQVIVVEVAANEVAAAPVLSQGVPINNGGMVTIDLTGGDKPGSSSGATRIVDKVEGIMDDQFSCQICSELFVTAVTLGCCHTFCQYCIHEWMKKKRDCPICRAIITTVTRSIVLDNFIEQMVNDLSTQHKERRKELVNQRKSLATVGSIKLPVKKQAPKGFHNYARR